MRKLWYKLTYQGAYKGLQPQANSLVIIGDSKKNPLNRKRIEGIIKAEILYALYALTFVSSSCWVGWMLARVTWTGDNEKLWVAFK